MSKKQWYCIENIDSFVDEARKLVFKFFGENNEQTDAKYATKDINVLLSLSKQELDELNSCLSFDEAEVMVKQLVKTRKASKFQKEKFYINDTILNEIIEALNARLVSNILSNLVKQGILDSAFDSESNDFVFWIKQDVDLKSKPRSDNNEKPNPETD